MQTECTAADTEIGERLDNILQRLGDPADWEYVEGGGPQDQSGVPDEIKQVRFLYYYVRLDGGLKAHDLDYVIVMLDRAERLLTQLEK